MLQPQQLWDTLASVTDVTGAIDGTFRIYLVDNNIIHQLRVGGKNTYQLFENCCRKGSIGFNISISSGDLLENTEELKDKLYKRDY